MIQKPLIDHISAMKHVRLQLMLDMIRLSFDTTVTIDHDYLEGQN